MLRYVKHTVLITYICGSPIFLLRTYFFTSLVIWGGTCNLCFLFYSSQPTLVPEQGRYKEGQPFINLLNSIPSITFLLMSFPNNMTQCRSLKKNFKLFLPRPLVKLVVFIFFFPPPKISSKTASPRQEGQLWLRSNQMTLWDSKRCCQDKHQQVIYLYMTSSKQSGSYYSKQLHIFCLVLNTFVNNNYAIILKVKFWSLRISVIYCCATHSLKPLAQVE